MAVSVHASRAVAALPHDQLTIEPTPATVGALIVELERRHPGAESALNSSAVNAAVNGDVILHGRDSTPLHDGDEVEFLVMFAGG